MTDARLRWDHFEAVEVAKFLHESIEVVKRMTPKELTAAMIRRLDLNARERKRLPGVAASTYSGPTTSAKG